MSGSITGVTADRLGIDHGRDLHTHSTWTDGQDTPHVMAAAAAAAGLHTWGLSDHVRADSDWVAGYVAMVRALHVNDLRILCGVETKMLDITGRLDLPPLPDLDYVLVADHQFPSAGGPLHPRQVTQALADGTLLAQDVVDDLVAATCAAVRQAPARPIVVHPFSLLPKIGLTEDRVHGEHLHALASACRAADASIEINEKWRCPSATVIARLDAAGVELIAGSDAHRHQDIGVWSYLNDISEPIAVRAPGGSERHAPLVATTP